MPYSLAARLLENRDLGNGNFLAIFDAAPIASATRPAQFVMLRVGEGTDPLLARPFSVARIGRGQDGPTVDLLYRASGRGTALLAGLAPGARAGMVGPLGHPFPEPAAGGQVICVAGGIGVAPFPLLGDYLRSRGLTPILLYGARSKGDLIGRDLLASAGLSVMLATDDGSEGFHGRIGELLDRELAALDPAARAAATAYVCGPTPMMAAVDGVLAKHGTSGHFSVEAFMGCGFGVCLSCVVRVRGAAGEDEGYRRVCVDGPSFPAGRIAWPAGHGP